jgi:hypothetical protein
MHSSVVAGSVVVTTSIVVGVSVVVAHDIKTKLFNKNEKRQAATRTCSLFTAMMYTNNELWVNICTTIFLKTWQIIPISYQ